jgi:hypothetical protein
MMEAQALQMGHSFSEETCHISKILIVFLSSEPE